MSAKRRSDIDTVRGHRRPSARRGPCGRMRRRALVWLAALWLVAAAPAAAQFTLTILTLGPTDAMTQRVTADFESRSVGVKVISRALSPGAGNLRSPFEALNAVLMQPDAPDIIQITPDWIAPLAAAGAIAEINPNMVSASEIAPVIGLQPDPIVSLGQNDDRNWAVSLTFDLVAVQLDQSRIAEAGLALSDRWNWRSFLQDGLKLSRLYPDRNRPGVLLGRSPGSMLPFYLSNGGTVTTPDFRSSTFLTEPNIETADWLQQGFRRAAFGLNDDPARALLQGDAAMVVAPVGPLIAAQTAGRRGLALAQLPFSPYSQSRRTLILPGLMFALNAHSTNPRLALDWLSFALNRWEQDNATYSGRLPTREDVALTRVPADARNALTLLSTYAQPLAAPQYALFAPDSGAWQAYLHRFADLTDGRSDPRAFVADVHADLQAIFKS
ncbi:MAG TPA: extracellular solute-binding protein [Limnochordia bacterium]|nr:extracellular solute-binding protein [Limnochordia bacterium]